MLIEHIPETIPFFDKKYFKNILSLELFQCINTNLYNRIHGNVIRNNWSIFEGRILINQYTFRKNGPLKEGEYRIQLKYQREIAFADFYYDNAWKKLL